MSDITYQSPEHPTDGGQRQVQSGNDGVQLANGVGRFVLHMLIASVLAPGAGNAVLMILLLGNELSQNHHIVFRIFASMIGGPLLLFFVWPIVIAFGLMTYLMCLGLREWRLTSKLLWAVGGAITGLVFGLFMGVLLHLPLPLMGVDGAVIGSGSGLLLRQLWKAEEAG